MKARAFYKKNKVGFFKKLFKKNEHGHSALSVAIGNLWQKAETVAIHAGAIAANTVIPGSGEAIDKIGHDLVYGKDQPAPVAAPVTPDPTTKVADTSSAPRPAAGSSKTIMIVAVALVVVVLAFFGFKKKRK